MRAHCLCICVLCLCHSLAPCTYTIHYIYHPAGVLMDDMIDLTTNDEDVTINNDDNYTRPKIPLRRKQSSNHRVIDALVYII